MSNDESEEDQESTVEENHTSLTDLLVGKCYLQIIPQGVALGVATSGRNILETQFVLILLLEIIQLVKSFWKTMMRKLLWKVFKSYTKSCTWIGSRGTSLSSLSKENTELKGDVSKLEVILCKKNVELGTVKGKLEKVSKTLTKFNTSSSTLDFILMMGKDDDKAGLGYTRRSFETG